MSLQLLRVSGNIPKLQVRFLSTTSKLKGAVALDRAQKDGEDVVIDKVDNSKIKPEWFPKIGNRRIVGYGLNGQACYSDRPDFPYPAVEFREPTPEIMELREKEKGDWKNLSIDEIKQLYRSRYCQTFAEFSASTGEWKEEWAFFMWGILLTLFMEWYLVNYVYPPLPRTTNKEWQLETINASIEKRQRAIEGFGYLPRRIWDYEKDEWKK
ncbi:hypothetical protein KUTeg_019584 [Tegillarca granosa]|uniref:Cytochrome c oxidase subunit 4 n=1 Tax=Tegillarca granosa TaxID=220873 RepID=A0ABQ9ECZ6_TEGGR|nr:hypothetical protein KUTeg_019584 [Tegillarca granosa]